MDTMLPFEKIKREVLVRKESVASSRYGSVPGSRSTKELVEYGIINVDKPKGPTSHQVVDYVKRILNIGKAGHSGTLDPGVTGVLPVALGRGTRVVQTLLTAGKEYVALMHLHKPVEDYQVYKGVEQFIGKIQQLPPVKCAVKRQLRERSIYYIEILGIDGQDVLFKVGCEAGTYIRKLIHDLGKKIGVGAHMAQLRRTKVASFDESTVFTLQDLADAWYYFTEEENDKYLRKIIQPIENSVSHLPKIWVLDSAVDSLCHGINLKVPGISKLESGVEPDQRVVVFSLKGELVCLGKARLNSKKMLGEKGIAVEVNKVFMLPDTYPKV